MRGFRAPRFAVPQPKRPPLPYVVCPTVTEAYDEFLRTGEFSFAAGSASNYDGEGSNMRQFDLDSVVPNQDLLQAAAVAGRTANAPQPSNPESTPKAPTAQVDSATE